MEHSFLYNIHVETDASSSQKKLKAASIVPAINAVEPASLQVFYSKINDLFRETNDAQFGIVSGLEGTEWIRDATKATAIADRMPHDSPVIEANNALMRCLSRLRPIDYAIEKKNNEAFSGNRQHLQESFARCTKDILNVSQSDLSDEEKLKAIQNFEEQFNTILVKELHNTNLTQGCESKKDAEKLLFHYRNLSSLLNDPARTMITLTLDKKANVLHRETQYPVTEKTEKQKKAMAALKEVKVYPFDEEKNAHTAQKAAFQEADSLFYDLMIDDNRALPAQARKTHLVGTKNAFIVKYEVIPLSEAGKEIDDKKRTLWLARSGSPVYVGPGEDNETINEHTQENLEQIRIAAKKRRGLNEQNIHLTSLVTFTPHQGQMDMIKSIEQSMLSSQTVDTSNKDEMSYVPTNVDGTFRKAVVAQSVRDALPPEQLKPQSLPLQKKDRVDQAVQIILLAAQDENNISTSHCASGQDRTGTVVEKTLQTWVVDMYHDLELDPSNIEAMRAEGGNAAEIASHLTNGSPGLKLESLANNYFGKEATFSDDASKQFYRASAETNKKNKVADVHFLSNTPEEAHRQFKINLKIFKENLREFKEKITTLPQQQFYDSALVLSKNVTEIYLDSSDKARQIADLNSILIHSANLISNTDRHKHGFEGDVRRLASLANHVSGKRSPALKALGSGLLTFSCLALVVIGVLAAIPSGGTSLLLTVTAATGLSIGAAATLGGGVIAASAIAGAVIYKEGSQKGLAHASVNFKSALKELRPDEGNISQPTDRSINKK